MTSAPPADRYGSAPRKIRSRTRSRWVLTALVVLAGLGVAYLGYVKFAVKDVEGKQITYDIVDSRTMNIQFTVTRDDPSQPAVCVIRARSKDGSESGRREVYVEPSSSQTVEITAPVITSQPPAVGDVYGCSLDVPGYLHAG